ncbi:MAG: phosphosulfolactate synthase [Chloroflexota bacterium]|nr:phosphosulfolactate synthase [Chloroflexota bacterium]MDE2952447.1 phosphosulfolactate synthase [Chloroflexota bacterium]
MPTLTMSDVFKTPYFEKPRQLRQTWLKDVGYDEAPNYIERMGLAELEDFLEVAGQRLDYVKIVTTQVIFSPHDWLKRKIATYQRFAVEPYLDHSFFMQAYGRGVVESAIEAGRELGFRVIEFMNTTDEVSAAQWKAWRKLALDLGMRVIQEHHPLYHWDPSLRPRAASADEILRGAEAALEDGAFIVMIDHEEFDLQGEHSAREIGKVVDALGLENIVFEATSPKEGPMLWRDNLELYFSIFGENANVANVMPSQAMYVEEMRAPLLRAKRQQ